MTFAGPLDSDWDIWDKRTNITRTLFKAESIGEKTLFLQRYNFLLDPRSIAKYAKEAWEGSVNEHYLGQTV